MFCVFFTELYFFSIFKTVINLKNSSEFKFNFRLCFINNIFLKDLSNHLDNRYWPSNDIDNRYIILLYGTQTNSLLLIVFVTTTIWK